MKHANLEACRETLNELPWLANGTLPAERAAYVQEHVAECAACRRELEFLQQLVAHMPEARAHHPGAPAFSQLLNRITRRDRRVRGWKMAAAVMLLLGGVVMLATPVYLLQPRYQGVTDILVLPAETVQMQVTFESGNAAALARILEQHKATLVAGPLQEGEYVLEFPVSDRDHAQALARELETDSNIRSIRHVEP